MDKVTRYEWHGNWALLFLLCLMGITLPYAVVYFTTNLLKIETQIKDADQLSLYLHTRK